MGIDKSGFVRNLRLVNKHSKKNARAPCFNGLCSPFRGGALFSLFLFLFCLIDSSCLKKLEPKAHASASEKRMKQNAGWCGCFSVPQNLLFYTIIKTENESYKTRPKITGMRLREGENSVDLELVSSKVALVPNKP